MENTDPAAMKAFNKACLELKGCFTDYTVVCNGHEFAVHKIILASHSEWFRKCFQGSFVEASKDRMELKEDKVVAVAIMLHYFYAWDYDDDPHALARLFKGGCIAQDDKAQWRSKGKTNAWAFFNLGIDNPAELHIWVYAVAEKYQLPALKALARTKFRSHLLSGNMDDTQLSPAIMAAYTEAPLPANETFFRLSLVYWCLAPRRNVIRVMGDEQYLQLLQEAPGFALRCTKLLLAMRSEDHEICCESCSKTMSLAAAIRSNQRCPECISESDVGNEFVGSDDYLRSLL